MDHTPFDYIAISLFSLLGVVAVAFLALELWDWRRQKTPAPEPADRLAAKQTERSSATTGSSRAKRTSHEPGPKQRAHDDGSSALRTRLQKLLDRGVALEQGTPATRIETISAAATLLRSITREEDVDAWEADVEAALRGRPRDIALFRYERPRSPLEGIGAAAALANPLKRRLQQRNHQLATIIARLP
jgi:hypothetical protein